MSATLMWTSRNAARFTTSRMPPPPPAAASACGADWDGGGGGSGGAVSWPCARAQLLLDCQLLERFQPGISRQLPPRYAAAPTAAATRSVETGRTPSAAAAVGAHPSKQSAAVAVVVVVPKSLLARAV